jgi:hypothetical protein
METKILYGFPKEAYKKMPTRPDGEDLLKADYNRWVGRRKARAKKSREQEFLEIGENEFLDKKLITTGLEEIKTKLNVDNGEARAIISKLEDSGHAVYNSYSTWNLTADGYKKFREWDVALGIKTKVEPISVTEYMKDVPKMVEPMVIPEVIPKVEMEIEKPKVVEVKTEIKKEWWKMAKDEIVYTNLFEGVVEIGKSKAIKVAISKSNAADAVPLLNVREWYLPNGETEMRPTKKGFTFRATDEKVAELVNTLNDAREVL